MDFKIAPVSFLNTVPLVEWFLTEDGRGHHLKRTLPSRVADLLALGEAHVGLLPVAVALSQPNDGFLGCAGIACRGPVGSVKVFSASPLSEVVRVRADRGSRSSVALLRILLAELHGTTPEITEVEPGTSMRPDSGESLLVIGDRCFEYEGSLNRNRGKNIRGWDLGELWHSFSGLPFVFAAWTLAPGFLAEHGKEQALILRDMLNRALEFGMTNLDDLARRESRKGRIGVGGDATYEAVRYYFRNCLQFKIGAEEISGMRHFQELGIKHGIFPDAPFPPVL